MTVPTESELATGAEVVPAEDEDFNLDIRFTESGPVVEELLRPTDDGCGKTCESACMNTCP